MVKFLPNFPWNKPKILPWVILFFAALNVIFLGGKRRAFGGFVAVLRKEFVNVSLTELNWIGDSYSALGYIFTGLCTMMILHFNRNYGLFQFFGTLFILLSCLTSSIVPNPHWMFLTHTLFHGIGSCLVISTVGLVVNEHFDHKHPYHLMATTLVSGGSVASILFVTFFAYLIQNYNWRIAFLILGGSYFGINLAAAFVFKKNEALTEYTDKKKMSIDFTLIRSKHIPLMVLWFMDRVLTSVVTYGLLLNLTDYVHRTQPNLVSSTVLTILFATGEASTYLIGAVITAATRDFFKNKLKYILLVTSFILGSSLVILEFTKQHKPAARALCFIAGVSMGPSIAFLFPAGEELTRLPGHMAYPFSLAGMGTGMMISPLLTAKVAEIFLYEWFFFVQGCLIFVKFVCICVITILLFYYKRFKDDADYMYLMSTDEEDNADEEPSKESMKLISKAKSKE